MPPLTFTIASAICCGRLAGGVAVDSAGAAAALAVCSPRASDRLHPSTKVLAVRAAAPARVRTNQRQVRIVRVSVVVLMSAILT
jgi:hypothetical protein